MGRVIVGTTMSLDGFVADREGRIDALYPDLEALRQTELLRDEIRRTGAALMGRGAFDLAGGDLTGYEFQVPIFVLTHHPPEQPVKGQNDRLRVIFVTDGVESAVRQARAAAGERDVMVIGGACTARQVLRAGLADLLSIGIVPLLLGDGPRLFDGLDPAAVRLDLLEVLESPGRTDIRYRVV
ncbi:MAG TPA: dihydrofolate reductase family protein [Thermomicrobiaceae bacterium]|nr:dihydrofolate reductase family protein [Thermomicrobiaceae bacterium]